MTTSIFNLSTMRNRLVHLWNRIKGNRVVVSIVSSRDSFYYLCLAIGVSVYLFFGVILNYSANWMHPEVVAYHLPSVLNQGNELTWHDGLSFFDWGTFEFGASRARFVSYAFETLNIKFRNWLFHYIPPHPSLSLTWIFTYLLSPFFLFKLTNNLSGNRSTASLAVLLYVVSTGFLSMGVLFFHSGKPLVHFFYIFCFYLASRLSLALRSQPTLTRQDWFIYLLLLGTMFTAFLTDETSYFLWVSVPILFIFEILRINIKRNSDTLILEMRNVYAILYLLLFPFFLFFVTFIIPILAQKFGAGEFNYWGYIFSSGFGSTQFQIGNLSRNIYYLLSSHLIPLRVSSTDTFWDWDIFFFVAYGIYFSLLFRRLVEAQQKIFLRTFGALGLFCIFQTAIQAKHVPLLNDGPFYYGAVFSLFFVLPVALLLSINDKPFGFINKVLLVLLMVIGVTNFNTANQNWQSFHVDIYQIDFAETKTMQRITNTNLTYPLVLKAWQNRNDWKILHEMLPQFSALSYGVFVDLDMLGAYYRSVIIESNYKNFSLVHYRGSYYAIPLADEARLSRDVGGSTLLTCKTCLHASTLEEVKALANISQIENLLDNITDQIKITIASSTNEGYGTERLFDRGLDPSSAWHSNLKPSYPQWFEISFTDPIKLERIAFQSQVGDEETRMRAPWHVIVQGGTTAQDLHNLGSLTFEFGAPGAWSVQDVTTTDSYPVYRLLILDNHGSISFCTVQELRLYGRRVGN